jgi:hypothetical protein
MKSIIFHSNKLIDIQAQMNKFLATGPEIIKMAQCIGFDPVNKEIDFVLTIIYK